MGLSKEEYGLFKLNYRVAKNFKIFKLQSTRRREPKKEAERAVAGAKSREMIRLRGELPVYQIIEETSGELRLHSKRKGFNKV